MSPREQTLRLGLSDYLRHTWNAPTDVTDLARIPGGASRETWKCIARTGESYRGLIVRIDPVSSLIDTDRPTEYLTTEAMYRAGIPVAEPLRLEEDSRWLGRPFSISAEVSGCQASPENLPLAHRSAMGRQLWSLLGEIARLDPVALGLDRFMSMPTVATCAMEQLDYWHKVIVDDELHPNPVARAAVRWLQKHPPPPAQKLSLVHGDYRTGNFLYTSDGDIKAILDWEMAHIGDPLEDLAWSLDPLWHWQQPELAGRLVPHKEAIRHWEEASGLELDVEAFRWWQIFASLKGIGIWISSSEDFHSGASKDPILAIAGWLMTDRQQQILLDYLSPSSPRRFYEVTA